MDFLAVRGGVTLPAVQFTGFLPADTEFWCWNVTDLRQSGERWLSARQCMTELLL